MPLAADWTSSMQLPRALRGNRQPHQVASDFKIKLMKFGDTAGAPSQAVVQLVKQAYEDGNDYFFQCNDDTVRLERRRASFRRRAALISLAS